MADYLMKAKLFGHRKIKIILFSHNVKDENPNFMLVIDGGKPIGLKISKISFQFGTNIYEINTDFDLDLGHDYMILTNHYGAEPLDVSNVTTFDDFDQLYSYDGPLGAEYHKGETIFRLWAPLASKVELVYSYRNKQNCVLMERSDHGVYQARIEQNLAKAVYYYLVTNNGLTRKSADPYALASTLNANESVVLDPASVKINLNENKLPAFKSPTEAIIYEMSVRDLTIDKTTNIVAKGTYKGLTETGRSTRAGFPAGYDYVSQLGITHIQLMPVYDFSTIDEEKPRDSYNWGYDPAQYFVPEGSYASNINDPLSRINELKAIVAKFHADGIRVNMDVVYNHVYEAATSIFERVVPNYYFRRGNDGKMANGSFCGNDLASERPMVRRLIIDACLYWVKEFGIDGFRFDLMGIIDIETMTLLSKKLRKIKPDILLYGEGWNMPTTLNNEDKSSHDNADRLPHYSFFNDAYREIVKGATSDDRMGEKGYLLGAFDYRLGFKFAYLGSCVDYVFPPRFKSAGQSINYVECHDNSTLYDKLVVATSDDSESDMLKRIMMINAVVMLSFGIPFYHKGQEIGLTKFGDTNSYRSSDRVNQFAYVKLDERFAMVRYFRALTTLRKESDFLSETDPKVLEKLVEFRDLDQGGLVINFKNLKKYSHVFKQYTIIINPSKQPQVHELDDYAKIIFNNSGYVGAKMDTYVKRIMVPPLSVLITGLRLDDEGYTS